MNYTVSELSAAVAKLPEGKQDFALSLVAAWNGRGLSEKQAFWAHKLIDMANTPAAPLAVVGDVLPIVTMIRGAGRSLKRPALLIATDGPDTLRITIAGEASREPGTLNVTTTTKGDDGRYGWIGRILLNGEFRPASSLTPNAVQNVTRALVRFAADPAGEAAAYGKKTGACCFCSRTLTDGVSVAMGYGPICADKWNLPHSRQAALACEAVAA